MKPHWLLRSATIRWLWLLFVLLLVATLLAGLWLPRHGTFGADGRFGFNAWYGFATCIGMILSEPGDPVVRVGDYPDGENEHRYPVRQVTVRRQGVVRDFIKLVPRFPAWAQGLAGREVWPWIFNVADAALVCGVGVLLIHIYLDRKPRRARG